MTRTDDGAVPRGAVVVGIGPRPDGLHRSVTWHPAPFGDDAAPEPRIVAAWIAGAAALGASRFVVPMARAEWLADAQDLADELVGRWPLVDAPAFPGIVFDIAGEAGPDPLAPSHDEGDDSGDGGDGSAGEDEAKEADGPGAAPEPGPVEVDVDGWSVDPDVPGRLVANDDLVDPRLVIRLRRRLTGTVRGRLTLVVRGVGVLRLRFGTAPGVRADVYVDLADPVFVHHELDFLEVNGDPATGVWHFDFDLTMLDWEGLRSLSIGAAEPDNWRLHPGYRGGKSFRLRPRVPAGAVLEVVDLDLEPTDAPRRSPAWRGVAGWSPRRYRKTSDRRDAVIFSSWVPENGLDLGEYFLRVLERRHGDSKIFVGVNHGSSPRWPEMVAASGLDTEVRQAPAPATMPFDPTGFVAALDAYRRCEEPFDLVWFGHNKGGLHLVDREYGRARWAIERWFWGAREDAEAAFADPAVGVWAPHWLPFLPEQRDQTDALARMYEAPCAPLFAMAVSAHFVMREACARDFVRRVDKRLFTHGVEAFGGDRYFFEFAMPNVPIVQGYEPFVGEGVGGRSARPAGGDEAVLNDWRQNNAMVRHMLDKWRADPTGYAIPNTRRISVP